MNTAAAIKELEACKGALLAPQLACNLMTLCLKVREEPGELSKLLGDSGDDVEAKWRVGLGECLEALDTDAALVAALMDCLARKPKEPGPMAPGDAACVQRVVEKLQADLRALAQRIEEVDVGFDPSWLMAVGAIPLGRWRTHDELVPFERETSTEIRKVREHVEWALNHLRWRLQEEQQGVRDKMRASLAQRLTPQQYRLVDFMWDRDEAAEQDVINWVYGHDAKQDVPNLKTLMTRLSRRLMGAGVHLGWELARKGGMVLKVRDK